MSNFQIQFLGTSAARPTARRGLSANLISVQSERVLLDCGEGTQRQMLIYGSGFSVDCVLFSHFHADHYLGIIGFLRTLAMHERVAPLPMYGPAPDLHELLERLIFLGYRKLPFPLELVAVGGGAVIERAGYSVQVVDVVHAKPAVAYVFEEPQRPGKFDIETARALGVPEGPLFGELQRGRSITIGNKTVQPAEVMGPARPGRRVAFSGDTRPCDALVEAAAGADLLVHEATFLQEDSERAVDTTHSTAREAGEVAARAGVEHLVLNHISSRYMSREQALVDEAREVYSGPVSLAEDGMCLEVPYRG